MAWRLGRAIPGFDGDVEVPESDVLDVANVGNIANVAATDEEKRDENNARPQVRGGFRLFISCSPVSDVDDVAGKARRVGREGPPTVCGRRCRAGRLGAIAAMATTAFRMAGRTWRMEWENGFAVAGLAAKRGHCRRRRKRR